MDTTSSLYSPAEVQRILEGYRALFPFDEMTPVLRDYWGLDRTRAWSYVATDFHAATYRQALDLHHASSAIETKWLAGQLTAQAKGEALRQVSRDIGVGYSLGVNSWTDNLLLNTFDPQLPRRNLVVIVGHDWYPVGAGSLAESGLWRQGLHDTKRYRYWCPLSFFRQQKNQPVLLFLNLFPDFRVPGAKKTGSLPSRLGYLSYSACMDGLKEVLRIVSPKFEQTTVMSWGSEAWQAMAPLLDDNPVRRGLKEQQKLATGQLLRLGGLPYFPMAHPSFGSNHHKAHLRAGFAAMGLGQAKFDT